MVVGICCTAALRERNIVACEAMDCQRRDDGFETENELLPQLTLYPKVYVGGVVQMATTAWILELFTWIQYPPYQRSVVLRFEILFL